MDNNTISLIENAILRAKEYEGNAKFELFIENAEKFLQCYWSEEECSISESDIIKEAKEAQLIIKK